MASPSAPRQAAIVFACVVAPLRFNFSIRFAIVGLPLVAFFPAIAIATTFASLTAGAFVFVAAVVTALLAMGAPPLNFTLGMTLNGMLFVSGFAVSGLVIYLLQARYVGRSVREEIRVEHELALSGALSRWLSRNAHAAAGLMRTIDDGDLQRATQVARERLLMTSRVEGLLRNCVARDGADLSGVMTNLCHEIVRAERRPELRGAISIAPMALEHEDFIRICLVMADLLYLALREKPSAAEPLQVSLRLEAHMAVLSLHWLRADTPSWKAVAHRAMTERVAGRVARVLGGGLGWSPSGAGPAWSALRFPAPAQKPPARWRLRRSR